MPFRIIDLNPFVGFPTGLELAEVSNNGVGSFKLPIAILANARQPNNVTTPGVFNLTATNYGDVLVNVAAAVTVQLPSASLRLGVPVSVVDVGGNAGTTAYNITIVPTGLDLLIGQPFLTISTNYSAWTIWPNPAGGWYQK